MILANARVITLDPRRPVAEAVGVSGRTIAAVGTLDEVRAALPGAPERDLGGATVTPGLVDAHGHLVPLGRKLETLDLSLARSPEEVAQRVAEQARRQAAGTWILGQGWDHTRFPGGRFPDRAPLDAAAPRHPVFLERVDGHAAWLNKRALDLAGIRASSVDPPGGRIVRREDGTAAGVLVDAAMRPALDAQPQPSAQDLERMALAAARRCAALGLTGVHDAGMSPKVFSALERLEARGELPIRVWAMCPSDDPQLPEVLAAGPRPMTDSNLLALRTIKFFLDGALGSRGAALFEEYADEPGNRGLLLILDLEGKVREVSRHGFQAAVHAIGDRANALALDAFEAAAKVAPAARLRPRIEHAQILRRDDIPRFARLGVVASVQPVHAVSDMRWVGRRLGEARLRGAYAWKSLADSGARLAFGSDFPIEDPNPLLGLHAASTRQSPDGEPADGWFPEERLDRAAALAAFTAGPALAAFAEDRLGSLVPGNWADLSVWDRDLLSAEPAELLAARPRLTMVAGRVVHDAGG